MTEDISTALAKLHECSVALAISRNPYDILIMYEDMQEKVNSLFRAVWESLEIHDHEREVMNNGSKTDFNHIK
jgi:hypothetical protein